MEKLNSIQQHAFNLVNNTNVSFFLTGRAGTGKTTLLKYIQQNVDKNIIVVAFTGVAAVNAGGETINSMFGIPIDEVVTRNTEFQLNPTKQAILRKADTIIIDEVSMVRPDYIDGIHWVLCSLMHSNLPFGGKQVVFVGDMRQLEPVISRKSMEWNILQDIYGAGKPYFYKAHICRHLNMPRIELQEVYRQKDPVFLDILENIRNYRVNQSDLVVLNSHVKEAPKDAMCVRLATRNDTADNYNKEQLDQIQSSEFSFLAVKEGKFPDAKNMPAPENLVLKVGAQVMFTRNDSNRRWVNGTMGKISSLSEESIIVELENGESYEVEQVEWEKYDYSLDPETKKVTKELVGTYTQYPLRLAWAITIHKSQGMTFNQMILDLSRGIFASGQLYVALSRVRSLEGLTLTSPVLPRHIIPNVEIDEFSATFNDEQLIQEELLDGSAIYASRRKGDIDGEAKACLEVALRKLHAGKKADAIEMLQRMFNSMICDDHMLNMTAEEPLLEQEDADSAFINSVLCLYGGRYAEGVGYAMRVIEERPNWKEACYVQSRCHAALGEWQEADILNDLCSDLIGKQFLRYPKDLYHWSRVNFELGQECEGLLKAILKNHPGYEPATSLLAKVSPDTESAEDAEE